MQRIGRCAIITLLLLALVTGAWGDLHQTINYQGYLCNTAGTPVNSTERVNFSFYTVSSGGSALWTETQSITPVNGIYSVQLGNVTAFPADFFASNDTLYLGIKVGADPEMTPRQQLTMTPYAFRAATADNVVNGLYSSGAYSDPAWLTSLAGNKISGTVASATNAGNANTVTNGLYSSGLYSNPAWLTSLAGSKITGAVASATTAVNASSVTNGVYTSGSYANPSWITSIDGSKITGSLSVTGQVESTGGGFKFPDGTVQISAKTDCMGRYEDNNDGTVTDCRTGIIWLKNTNCTETLGGINKGSGTLSWPDAGTWTANLTTGFCGLSDGSGIGDWRLPTKTEWMSMVTSAKKQGFNKPALTNGAGTAQWAEGDLFNNVQKTGYYWSSTTDAHHANYVWIVDMWSGNMVSHDTTYYYFYVWPVRGGQ